MRRGGGLHNNSHGRREGMDSWTHMYTVPENAPFGLSLFGGLA